MFQEGALHTVSPGKMGAGQMSAYQPCSPEALRVAFPCGRRPFWGIRFISVKVGAALQGCTDDLSGWNAFPAISGLRQ